MLPILCTVAFLVLAQAFMVAPLIPRLAEVFHSDVGWVGLAVPAYLLPYGMATLVWGPLSDRFGRRAVILGSLTLFIVFTAATVSATTVTAFVGWRLVTGIGASGVVPIGLTLIGDVVAFQKRGRALGWLFGAIAGGTAAGATVGALMEPVVGWQGLFLAVAVLAAVLSIAAVALGAIPRLPGRAIPQLAAIIRAYGSLLALPRGRRTYFYVLINAVVQSGVYTWLGVYLRQRFGLGEVGIGLALLGYGIPGLLFGPTIGRLADLHGRYWIIPAGVALTGACALLLAAPLTLLIAQAAIVALSLGYDLTQPLLAGIVTDLPGNRGQATGLMAFTLFTGFGLGSLLFQAVLKWGFVAALIVFGLAALAAAGVAVPLFRAERPRPLLPARAPAA
ncbi:MAG TPA: MFS transporter [Gemmatimonadaceae bacterium]|nr:MFS transporter [Gemmatimonadaceae bacterium]